MSSIQYSGAAKIAGYIQLVLSVLGVMFGIATGISYAAQAFTVIHPAWLWATVLGHILLYTVLSYAALCLIKATNDTSSDRAQTLGVYWRDATVFILTLLVIVETSGAIFSSFPWLLISLLIGVVSQVILFFIGVQFVTALENIVIAGYKEVE